MRGTNPAWERFPVLNSRLPRNLGFTAYATTDAPPLFPMSPRGIRWRPGHALNCATCLRSTCSAYVCNFVLGERLDANQSIMRRTHSD
jgi:hypothetical protein